MQAFPHHKVVLCAFVLCVLLLQGFNANALKLASVKTNYHQGVEAYAKERWSECIVQFEESLHLYKLYSSIITNCRLKCNSRVYESLISKDMEDLQVYEKFFNVRDCLNKCQEKGFEHTHLESELHESMLAAMQLRKPYEYLHVCYFQMNMMPKAASAAYTYLVANPDDKPMLKNLKYYIDQPEVDENEVIDLLSEDFMVLFKLGIKAYTKGNWGETVASMEEVISDYLAWENTCRVECERQPDQEWSPEFTITVSNNMASLLHCRQRCQDVLKALGYNSGANFLADVLNYLQISYYRLDRLNDAAKTVATYLVLLPQDEDMLVNKGIYETVAPNEAFKERSDIINYIKRDGYEKDLLHFFHQGNDNYVDSNAI